MKTNIEFNLSKYKLTTGEGNKVYLQEDVKEFIRLLKESIHIEEYSELMDKRLTDAIEKQIDKLAGDKLI
jgi:hypothetical protein